MDSKILQNVRFAAKELRAATTDRKNSTLSTLAEKISKNTKTILEANAKDLAALPSSATAAFRDRLLLDEKRLASATQSLNSVRDLGDPVGVTVDQRTLPNGLKLSRVRAPLGVIFMIFESRPNVVLEAFSLGFKSGNAMILRGGKESAQTTGVLYKLIGESLLAAGLSEHCLWGITDPDRKLVEELLKQRQWIDIVVPRGGDALIEFVVTHSQIPIIKNDRGLCHVYVHEDADLKMATQIVINAKTSRPGVCNAMETLLVHSSAAEKFLPALYDGMEKFQVEWFCCPDTMKILKGKKQVHAATATSFDTEYLDFKINCRVVTNLEEAIRHIEKHGSRHSESIVTSNEKSARKFQSEIDAAAVYWNASTRFTDGFEFGLGGELGISTQKLHVRGPVGLNELTNLHWVVDGVGQVRS